MNVMRIAILGVAAIAAGAAAILVRGIIGGGTPTVQAAPPAAITTDVLVASKDIVPGHVLSVDLVRWDAWPKTAVSSTLITKDKQPDMAKVIEGAVVRAPLVVGQPITDASIVHAGSAGFLAATMKPGMRAIGMTVTAQTSAGGFILPNDRVDVVLTRELPGAASPKQYASETILQDVRVLAVDQTAHQEKDQQSVVGKTATLELTQDQAELIAHAEQTGVLSLTLRALGDSSGDPTAGNAARPRPARIAGAGSNGENSAVVVFRYGILRDNSSTGPARSGGTNPAGTIVASNGGGSGSASASTPAPITNPITVTTTTVPTGVPQ